ncbi:MAG: hypothetical protein H0W62_11410 [Chitinophagales bacterium]|nr:hypothetical protein [Chitinophagales bacterium]
MALYKFRVVYEEDDSIFRDIEVKPSNTMIDFEGSIVTAYSLPSPYKGLFYKANDSWQRVKQIDIAARPDEQKMKGRTKAKAQSFPLLVTYIDDPHQKFVYEYKGSQEFVFLLELMSLSGSEKSHIAYPFCVKQQGLSPFKKEDLMAHYGRKRESIREEQVVDEEEVDIEEMSLIGEEDTAIEADDETEKTEKEDTDIADETDDQEEEGFIKEEDIPDDGFGEGFSEEDAL